MHLRRRSNILIPTDQQRSILGSISKKEKKIETSRLIKYQLESSFLLLNIADVSRFVQNALKGNVLKLFQKLLRRKCKKFLDLLNGSIYIQPTQIAKVHKHAVRNFQLPFKRTRCGVSNPSMRTCAEIYIYTVCLRECRAVHNPDVSPRIRAT